jgi:hypothetical protein
MKAVINKLGVPDLAAIIAVGQEASVKKWPTYLGGALDRKQYATASEIGGCLRQAAFGKRGAPVPFKDWGYAERGHAVEAWVAERFRLAQDALDWTVEFNLIGDEQVSFTNGAQSGTPDGLVHYGPKTWVLDIKSVDPRSNWAYFPKQKHTDQVMQNIDLVRSNTTLEVVGGIVFYIDASDFQKAKQFSFAPDEARILELRERALRIVNAASPEDLPAEGMFNDGCAYCPYTALCSAHLNKEAVNDQKLRDAEGVLANVFRKS